jgi:hypothetical protein
MSDTFPTPRRQWLKPPYSWAETETASLVDRYHAGASLDVLAAHFDRSPHHVVVQLAWAMCGVGADQLNPLAPRFREPWSDDEHRLLEAHYRAGRDIADISRELDRDMTDVAWRLVTERICDRTLTQAG